MKQSTSSRRQPIVIMITTSGTVRESVFDNIYELACNIADGKITEDTFCRCCMNWMTAPNGQTRKRG